MLQLKMNIKLPTVALAALLFAGLPLASSSAQIGISVAIAPPEIPVYEQPLCPTEGYLWTPPYWAYADFGYYLVPGVWVAPPRVGVLWTPGYWGFNDGLYAFNEGYWGPTVGFYGGINYGFGYPGQGYYGGEWAGDSFRYNTAVTRVDTSVIHNTYVNNRVVNNTTGSRASFNGPGGAQAKPTAQEQAAAKAEHIPPTPTQRSRVEAAKNNPALHAANNHGKPAPEAIKALDRSNGHQPAAAATGGSAGVKKEKGGALQEANGSHTTAKAARSKDAAAPQAHEARLAKHNGQTGNAAAPHAVHHAQVVPHRPPAATARQTTGPAAPGRAPARAEQPAKKQKPGVPPGGGQ
jgi:YXWGXW repeat-containing protein